MEFTLFGDVATKILRNASDRSTQRRGSSGMEGAETLILCHSIPFSWFIICFSCFNTNNIKKMTILWRYMSNNLKIQVTKLSTETLSTASSIRSFLSVWIKGMCLNTQWCLYAAEYQAIDSQNYKDLYA